MLLKTLESPLDCKEIKSVNPNGNQSWILIGTTHAEAEAPILWPPHAKSWLIGKDPDAGRDWGQEEKGMTENEMAGWHHQLDGHEFEWTLGVGDGQGGLACCNSWGHKETDMAEWLNWTELHYSSDTAFRCTFPVIFRYLLKFIFLFHKWACTWPPLGSKLSLKAKRHCLWTTWQSSILSQLHCWSHLCVLPFI